MKNPCLEKNRAPSLNVVRDESPRLTVAGCVASVLQVGALGTLHVAANLGLHEAHPEPELVIGNPIRAVNGAIIGGNLAEQRMTRRHGVSPRETLWCCGAVVLRHGAGTGRLLRHLVSPMQPIEG